MSISLPSGVSLTWVIRQFDIARSITVNGNTYEDVVHTIHFRIRVINQYRRGYAVDSSAHLDLSSLDPAVFTKWDEVTELTAQAWIESALGQAVVNQLEQQALDGLINPDQNYATLPNFWVQDPIDLQPV